MILGICSIVFGIGTIIGLVFLKRNIRYVLNRVLHNVFYIITVVCIGNMLYILGLTPQIEYIHFNVIIFVLSVTLVIGYGILESIIFKKLKTPALQLFNNIEYVIFFELFLVTITDHLEILEWITGTLAILCIEIIDMIVESMEYKRNIVIPKVSGYPNPDLFYTREKQLEKFIPVLEQQKEEPYAIMISGEWGVGKSSFVQALEKRLTKDAFIWIHSGSEKSVSEIMMEISEQILKILKKNNVLIEKGGLIEKYFLTFSGLLEETGIKFFKQISGILVNNKEEDGREYLNSKLEDLDKTIYLIIDDLDRCSKEYQEKMFKVIRESTELTHCKTIFLVDKAKFLNYDDNYIEKYISYTLELCEVQCKEILDYLIDDIIEDEFIQEMNIVLLKDRSAETVKRMICQFPDEIMNICEIEISKASDKIKNQKSKDTERKEEQKKVDDITRTVLIIRKNITNARKIKNYLTGIKRDISNLNVGIEECSAEFQKEDWLKAIIEVQFLKHILPELYANIKMSNDIFEFGRRYEGYSVDIILGMKYSFLIPEEKKGMILNNIIYNVDVIDFLQVKSEREKYLFELYNEAILDNIMEYLKYATTYNDFSKIVEVCTKQEFNNHVDRENFVKGILSIWAKQSNVSKIENFKFLDLSKQLVECLKQWKLTEKEKNICSYEGKRIIRRVIVDNSHCLRNILMMLFDVTTVENNWKTLGVSDIDEFYIVLKRIDSKLIYKGLEDENNILLSIRKYYTSLETELRKETYSNSGLDFERIFNEINTIFEICLLWNNIKDFYNSESKEDNKLVNLYFDLEGTYMYKSTVFSDIINLEDALNVLNKFYESKSENYVSNYSLILLRLTHSMVLIYESDKDWFKNKKEVICDLLESAAEKCYMYDKLENDYASKVIDELKVFVYRFCTYCRMD